MSATYKIGEAAALLNLKTYVLRFWETEFPQIVPLRTEKGQRLYTEEHLALLDRIRFLLHERGLTIEGARKVLAEESSRGVRYARTHSEEREFGMYSPAEDSPLLPEYGMAPAAQARDKGLTFSGEEEKDSFSPPGLGVGFETAGKTVFSAVPQTAPDDALQTDPADAPQAVPDDALHTAPADALHTAPADALHTAPADALQVAPDDALHTDPADALHTASADAPQTAPAVATPPPSDWEAIKNAFDAAADEEEWAVPLAGLSEHSPEQQPDHFPDRTLERTPDRERARRELDDLVTELEAVAELLRGGSGGTKA